MKHNHFILQKPQVLSAILLLIVGLVLLPWSPAAAQNPAWSPQFEQVVEHQASGGGPSIVSQRLVLAADDFQQTGQLNGLSVTPDGLTLSPGHSQGVYLSDPIASPLAVTTDIGLTWPANSQSSQTVSVELRVSQAGQPLGDWLTAPITPPSDASAQAGVLFWIDQPDVTVQFRLTLHQPRPGDGPAPQLSPLTLFFNDSSQGPDTAAIQESSQSDNDAETPVETCPAKPAIIQRTTWGSPTGAASPWWPPRHQPVSHIVLNQTVTPNSAADWPAVVRAIWHYHAISLGWGDIGYNYLIDPAGNVYEGRAGGENVIGAFDGFNRGGLGLGYLGCFGGCNKLGLTETEPTVAMLEAGHSLIAWQAGRQELDPTGSGLYCEQSLPTIVGRSNVTCRGQIVPAEQLERLIPDMRSVVAERLSACTLPDAPAVSLTPTTLSLESGADGAMTVSLANAVDIYGIQLQLSYNPNIAEIVDAAPDEIGIQIQPGAIFSGAEVFVVQNEAGDGTLNFSATRLAPAPAFTGSGSLLEITWRGQQPGLSDVTINSLSLVDASGQPVSVPLPPNAQIEVTPASASLRVTGRVILQGRNSSNSALVRVDDRQTEVQPDGTFELSLDVVDSFLCEIVAPGYLSAQANTVTPGDGSPVNLGQITLLGGDTVQDDIINIFDLAFMGSRFGSNDNQADINSDGLVDILDMTLAASNYGRQGPTIVGLADQLRQVIAQAGITPLDVGPTPNPAKVELGRFLYFDKLLGGNRDSACATCHLPSQQGGDGLSLSIGVGGSGLGPGRRLGPGHGFIPRNAPEIFNRGAPDWTTMFWDMRVTGTPAEGFVTPAGATLPEGLDNILAAQAMFPVTSRDEMRGQIDDLDIFGQPNELAAVDDDDFAGIWSGLMARLLSIPAYAELFGTAYPDTSVEALGFQHAANAIAAFEIDAFTFTNSPWDRFVAGDDTALTDQAKQGALLFFGEAGCAGCHAGNLFTDQQAHNIGTPQVGPGKGDESPLDFGRGRETNDPAERYAFRTPPLRNVALTGPWTHAGAFTSLESVVRHHLNPTQSLHSYNPDQLRPDLQDTFQNDEVLLNDMLAGLDPALVTPTELSNAEFQQLMTFLHSLTDPAAVDLSHIAPQSVPSGLSIDR